MTPGPLPPHERAWRHPSEIGAPAHEPTSRIGHFLIGSIAAVSLLLVAWLAISMTPKRYGDADEDRIVSSGDGAGTSFGLSAGSPGDAVTPAEHVLRAMSTIIAEQSREDAGQNASQAEATSTVAATFVSGADHPEVTEAATDAATSAEPTVPSTTVESTVVDPADTTPDTTTGAATEVIGAPVTDGAGSSSPDVLLLADPSESTASSGDPDADSTAGPSTSTSSSTSTTSTTSSTSTTSTTSTSTTSTSTVPTSMPPKQFS